MYQKCIHLLLKYVLLLPLTTCSLITSIFVSFANVIRPPRFSVASIVYITEVLALILVKCHWSQTSIQENSLLSFSSYVWPSQFWIQSVSHTLSFSMCEHVSYKIFTWSCQISVPCPQNHTGTLDSGHYTAFCKNPVTQNWHEFNDAKVTSISEQKVQSPAAYVLFYNCVNFQWPQ